MKTYLWLVVAAGMFLFSACSNDDDVKTSTDLTGQELIMRVVSSGDGLTTRAGRPLLSSEAAQAIDKVKIAIFSVTSGECVYADEVDWTKAEDYGGTSAYQGKYVSFNLKTKIGVAPALGLDPGDYKIYAVGYTSSGSAYATYEPTIGVGGGLDSWDGLTEFESVKATSPTGEGEEIFAGEIATVTVNSDRNFDEGYILYLHRQVAGAFGYFMNIPAVGLDGVTPATALRLVASGKNTVLDMTNFNTDVAAPKYVVNGDIKLATADAKFNGTGAADPNDAFTVYSITLGDWFPDGDTNNDGILNGDDTGWVIPTAIKDYFNAVYGSLFGGKFVIPFAKTASVPTFELQLVDGTGTILRYWTVKLATAQTGVVDAAGADLGTEDESSYSIVRNHLYSIGDKFTAKPSGTPNPPPGTGEQPTDLSKGQILTLHVNDYWEVVEKLVVEPGVE